jgi:hypothetical protein
LKNSAHIAPAIQPVRRNRSRPALAMRRCLFALVLWVLPLAAGLLAFPSTLHAQPAEASEEKVKAVYLYKFLSYVEWPASAFAGPGAPYQIGVMGDDLVASELAAVIAGKTVNDRAVMSRRIAYGESLADIDLLFIGRGERARQAALLRQLRSQPALTVTETETESGLDQGSIVNFRMVDSRIRFEVSVDAAEHAGLKLSARLLGVAINVVKGSR